MYVKSKMESFHKYLDGLIKHHVYCIVLSLLC
jgi:hypothetical protein